MGRVWRAVDEILDRLVAVKEMRIDGLDPEDTRTRRERTLREARATARIDHPNVVRVYDVVDEGERLWIVMELVAGRSLERIMAEEGPLGPCETARIGIGLVAALRQVHARGVLHRDIKPGNVLVETEVTRARGRGRVVLTDFGIAAIQDAKALTMVGMLVGSPDYMAPERISGRPQGPPSDIWSLGATLSAALAGRSPFSRDTTLATLHAVLYEDPELPPTAGPLHAVLTTLLQKDPTHRPGLDALERALEPVAFPVPTPTMPVVGGGGPGGGRPDNEVEGGCGLEGAGAEVAPEGRKAEAAPGLEGTHAETGPGEPAEEFEAGLGRGGAGGGACPGGPSAGGGAEADDGHGGRGTAGASTPWLTRRDVEAVSERGLQPPHGQVPGLQPAHGPELEPTPEQGSVRGSPSTQAPEPGSAPPPATRAHPSPASPVPNHPPTPKPKPQPKPNAATVSPTPPDPRQPDDVRDAIPPQASPATDDTQKTAPPAPPAPAPPAPARTAPARSEPAHPDANDGPPATTKARPHPTPTPTPDSTPTRTAARTSTELASQATSEARSEVRTPASPGNSGTVAPHRPGVSLARSAAVTEQRPLPAGPPPHGVMPPGELPGPAVPAEHPRRARRRTGKVAAVAIVAAGATVAVVLAINPGGPEDDHAGSSPSPSPSSSASASSTVEGTTRPQSLPPGSRREAGGFAWVPPEGWRRDVKTGSEVHYTSQDAEQELAAKSSLARDDLMDSWQKSEENARQGQQYRKIRLERTTFRGHPAVVWEYTFTLQGDPWHARLLGFTVDGKSYQINTWYRPDGEAEALKTYEKVRDSFTVL